MPAFSATSPGKIILFGEHAVVYGFPAIAIPVVQVRAKATVTPNIKQNTDDIVFHAPDVGLHASLHELSRDHPMAKIVEELKKHLQIEKVPPCTIRVTSTIPIASGLGSGAAVSVAILKALSAFLGKSLSLETLSTITYEVEKIYHGTPSGIDNTVITYVEPVYFQKGKPIKTFEIKKPFTLVIADTGVQSPTAVAVSDVRKAWQKDPETYESYFQSIGEIVSKAKNAIIHGAFVELGELMNQNHLLLQKIGVSSPELDNLTNAARDAGALGAKLSGGGRGGNMIALTSDDKAEKIAEYLQQAGAVNTIITQVGPNKKYNS